MRHADIPDGHMTVCPHCGSANIRRRQPQKPTGAGDGKNWWCENCHDSFHDFATRPRNDTDTPEPRGGLARRLLDADPDEVGP